MKKKKSASPRRRESHDRESGGVERTREELLRAARVLFSRQGFTATTVKQIADEAGVNISLISYHYNGKEGLFRACLHSFAAKRRELALRILLPPDNAEEMRSRLSHFLREMIDLFLADSEISMVIHCDLEIEVPVVEEIFRETLLPVFQTLVEFMQSAQKNGLIAKQEDPILAAGIFFGNLVHTMRSERISEKFFNRSMTDQKHRERFESTLVNIFCNGILVEG